MAKKIVETPLMKQYLAMKQKHPDALLLFRVGDFYETFSEDAIAASEILGITLTRRANGAASSVELAGFPHHALDTYLPRLVRAGRRVAICDQLEDPKLTNKLVKRGITELVTPGVALNDNVLDHKTNNFLAALHFDVRGVNAGVAFLDISTGEFLTAEGPMEYVDKLLGNLGPKELLVERGYKRKAEEELTGRYLMFELEDWVFTTQAATDRLLQQFKTASLKGYGVAEMPLAVIASGAILHYLDITQHTQTSHIRTLQRIDQERYVRLDRFTVRNLELTEPMTAEGKSLLGVIDRTVSPMGSRLLRRWLSFPLKEPKAINERLDIVEHFFRAPAERDSLGELLRGIGDLERLASKAAVGRISPREVVAVGRALRLLPDIEAICVKASLPALRDIGHGIDTCAELCGRIGREVMEDAPAALNRGPVFREGVDKELDSLRDILLHGREYLEEIRRRESQATGIPSLKVAYNNVFGYYIEVTNTHRDKVPAGWIRKQTLVNAERYITAELKEYEEKILTAQEKIEAIEARLYGELVGEITKYVPKMLGDAQALGRLDCLLSFCCVALENHYYRPVVDDSQRLEIRQGRHPVIERQLPPGTPYITNSLTLDNGEDAGEGSVQVMMITGPNMSGKSALLRSTALNVILAQIGSFVAAESAHIGVVDKIFTRVGASDNISLGESTFMVEMNEAASILNNMSGRSLILFDELGRGTSTYDGISIAWAIVEHLATCRERPKTLFATHYHELNQMAESFKGISNFHIAVKEIEGRVVFLRKLEPGGSEHSFGIHVARLAGMPGAIVERADAVLRSLEASQAQPEAKGSEGKTKKESEGGKQGCAGPMITPKGHISAPEGGGDGCQLSFFQLDDPVLAQIRDEILNLNINNLSPLQALNKLADIRQILTGK